MPIVPFSNTTITYDEFVEFSRVAANSVNDLANTKASIYHKIHSKPNLDYTLDSSDVDGVVVCDNILTITVPLNSSVNIEKGSEIIIVSRNSTVSLLSESPSSPKIWGSGLDGTERFWSVDKNCRVSLLKIDVDEWILSGEGYS